MNNSLDVGSVFKVAWEKFKPVWWKLALIFLGFFGLQTAVNSLVGPEPENNIPGMLFSGLVSILIMFISSYIIPRVSLMAVRGEPIGWNVFETIDWGLVIFAGLLSIITSIIYVLGFVLLIIPGIILVVRFGLSSFALVDEHLNPIDALKRSLILTKGYGMKIFIIGFVFILMFIVFGIATLGLAFIFIAPLMSVAMAHVYLVLKNNSLPTTEHISPPTVNV